MTISMNSLLLKEVNTKIKTNTDSDKNTNHGDNRLKRLQDFQSRINWDELSDSVFQHYLESEIGRLVTPTETMLKIYFLQIRYGMSALYIEKALIEVDILREFALIIDIIPDANSIEAFGHLLQEKELSETIIKAFTMKL